MVFRWVGKWVLVALVVFWASWAGLHSAAAKSRPVFSGLGAPIALAQLPPQAREMLVLIDRGGPFAFDKDGAVFGNRERILPLKPRGFYREYTVRTPGLRHRGARRIVCGERLAAIPAECYYTDDHYASFRKIER